MAVKTQEALSVSDKRQKILNLIPQFEIKPIFTRTSPLDREIVLGTVGDKGAGKSASCAGITLVDGMLAGKPVFSNMKLGCDIVIDDETARKYGLNSGGIAHYSSQPLIKDALLNLDDRYRNAYVLIEEINVEYANARKALTNTNTDFNEVCQQLRKFKTSLIYNVTDEMFVDVQLRALTDIFMKTYDTAYDMDKIVAHKEPGLDFCWTVYPMTAYLCGQQGRFVVTKKPLAPIYFHFGGFRGVYDSNKHQERGTYSLSRKEQGKAMMAQLSAESSPEMAAHKSKFAWLAESAQDLRNAGQKFVKTGELTQWIGQPLTRTIREWLAAYGIRYDALKQGYVVESYSIDQADSRQRRELVHA